MTIRIESPYSPADFFAQVENYSNDNSPLEIIFPDECTDSFSTIFNLNALLNVQKIEVPWNFGAGNILAKPFTDDEETDAESTTDIAEYLSQGFLKNEFYKIYFNNLKLLEISADKILEKKLKYILENKDYANNLMKTILVLPFPTTLKEIVFRPHPENKTPLFKFKEGAIMSFDNKFIYKKLTAS